MHDLAAELTRPLGAAAGPGRALLGQACDQIRATPPDDPLFPRAFSVSFEGLGAEGGARDVGLVFLDFGPPLDLGEAPDGVARAFSRLCGEASADAARDIGRLTEVSRGLRLDHVGAGRRRGRALHKAYLGGRLEALVARARAASTPDLTRPHGDALGALAAAVDARPAVMVVDVVAGEVVRVGFELNLDVKPSLHAGYAELVRASRLFEHAPAALGAALDAGPVWRALPDGEAALLEVSHLKVSFDGRGAPEWKLYLRVQKLPGTVMSERRSG